MCELLGEKYYRNSGTGRKNQLEDWKRYFEYEKVGMKFKIKEVFDKPKTKTLNQSKGKYIELIAYGLIQMTKGGEITTYKKQLFKELGIYSDQFYEYMRKNRNFDDAATNIMYRQICERFDTSFGSLIKNEIVSMNPGYIGISDDGDMIILDDEDISFMKQLEDEDIFPEYRCAYDADNNIKYPPNIPFSMYASLEGHLTEYLKIKRRVIKEEMGYKKVYKSMTISCDTSINTYNFDWIKELPDYRIELNKRINDSILSYIDKRHGSEISDEVFSKVCELIEMNKIKSDNSIHNIFLSQDELDMFVNMGKCLAS